MSSGAVIGPKWGQMRRLILPSRGSVKLDQAYAEIQITLPKVILRLIFMEKDHGSFLPASPSLPQSLKRQADAGSFLLSLA
jgi:hypothetical protein